LTAPSIGQLTHFARIESGDLGGPRVAKFTIGRRDRNGT
jgi:hypothetical protein